MKKLNVGNQTLVVKDYFCAESDDVYWERKDNKLWLYINVTDLCNAQCPFCVNPSKKSGANLFSTEILKKILLKIRPFVYGVSITGGEPMLFPELVDEVALLVEEILDENVELDLVTNGTNLNQLTTLVTLNRFESVHISRHMIDDDQNEKLMGFPAPKMKDIKVLIEQLKDPAKIVLNCVMQKDGISNIEKMSEYLEKAAWAGVRNTSFVGFFMANQFCRDNYISPAEIDLNEDQRFRVWNNFHDYDYCSCCSGDYRGEHSNVRFYYRCPGTNKANYCRQFVYTADNRLLDGFGGKEIRFD